MQDPKVIAVNFLKLITSGELDEAYEKYVDPNGKHHNPYTKAGMSALYKGMSDNEADFPNKKLTVKEVLVDDNMVAAYSHLVLKAGELEMAVVHIMRIENSKIVELWDCAQALPKEMINTDGPF